MTVVGRPEEFPSGVARRVDVDGVAVCVVRIDDEWFAIGDTCSHAEFPLSDGEVWSEECEIECLKHGASFSLRDGTPRTLPATQPVPVYRVTVTGDAVEVTAP